MNILIRLCGLPLFGEIITLLVSIFPAILVIALSESLKSASIATADSQVMAVSAVVCLVWNWFLGKRGLNIVLPVIPIPFWFGCLILTVVGTYYTYDELTISFFDANKTPFTIESVETHGVGDNRFIRITGGLWDEKIVYQYEHQELETDKTQGKVKFILLHLVSPNSVNQAMVQVLVKKATHELPVGKIQEFISTQLPNPFDIAGVLRKGFQSLNEETKNLIQEHMEVAEPFILIDLDASPTPLLLSFLIFLMSLAGILFGFYILAKIFITPSESTTTPPTEHS